MFTGYAMRAPNGLFMKRNFFSSQANFNGKLIFFSGVLASHKASIPSPKLRKRDPIQNYSRPNTAQQIPLNTKIRPRNCLLVIRKTTSEWARINNPNFLYYIFLLFEEGGDAMQLWIFFSRFGDPHYQCFHLLWSSTP